MNEFELDLSLAIIELIIQYDGWADSSVGRAADF